MNRTNLGRDGKRREAGMRAVGTVAIAFSCSAACAQVMAIPADERLVSSGGETKTAQQWLAELAKDRQEVAARPDSPESYLTLGKALRGVGDRDDALRALDSALHLQPDLSGALLEKGSILADDSQWSNATELFRDAVKVTPRSAEAHLWLGDMLLRGGDFAAAGEEFSIAARLDGNNSGAFQGLGLVSLQQGDFDKAAKAFRQALAIRPHYLDAQEGLAHDLMAAHLWRQAAETLRVVLAARPNSAADTMALGTAMERMGDQEDAKTEFARAKELSNQELTEMRTKGDNNWGLELKNQGRIADAKAAFRRALTEDPNFCEAHDNLGSVLWLGSDAVAAKAEFQAAVLCNPQLASARNNLGMALLYYGHDIESAIAQFRAAVAGRPGFAVAHVNLGKALAAKGAFAEAEREFRNALAIDPKMAAAHVGLGLVLATEKSRVTEEARAEMKEGLRLDPSLLGIIPRSYQTQLR
jgi:tetratricopeptide (TPR) repeat protein